MVTRENKRADLFAALELALSEILNVKNMNVWIAVKERSISKILVDAGVTNKNYLPVIIVELKKLGLIEREGERAGMRYKVHSNIIPDIRNLAQVCYENMKKKTDQYKGYPVSKKTDLVPPRKPENKSYSESSAAVVVKRQITIPSLGDMRYALKFSQIVEAKVIGMRFDAHHPNKIVYDIEFTDVEEGGYEVAKNVEVKHLFETPQALSEYLARKFVKYTKR